MKPGHLRKRRAEVAARISSPKADFFQTCTVVGCSRPTRRAAGIGLSGDHCTYHQQRKARFGSPFAPPIRATDLKPYLLTALRWIKDNREDPSVAHVVRCLSGLLYGAGPVDPVSGDTANCPPDDMRN